MPFLGTYVMAPTRGRAAEVLSALVLLGSIPRLVVCQTAPRAPRERSYSIGAERDLSSWSGVEAGITGIPGTRSKQGVIG